jgi:hypothetical protein
MGTGSKDGVETGAGTAVKGDWDGCELVFPFRFWLAPLRR